jgi:hypothetical protein
MSLCAPRLRPIPILKPTAPSPGLQRDLPDLHRPADPRTGDPFSLERGRQGFLVERRIVRCRAQRIGFQVSLYGLAGILVDADEGFDCWVSASDQAGAPGALRHRAGSFIQAVDYQFCPLPGGGSSTQCPSHDPLCP